MSSMLSLCDLRDFVPRSPSSTNVVSTTWDPHVRVINKTARTYLVPRRALEVESTNGSRGGVGRDDQAQAMDVQIVAVEAIGQA